MNTAQTSFLNSAATISAPMKVTASGLTTCPRRRLVERLRIRTTAIVQVLIRYLIQAPKSWARTFCPRALANRSRPTMMAPACRSVPRRLAQRRSYLHHGLRVHLAILLQLAAHALALIGAVNVLRAPPWSRP